VSTATRIVIAWLTVILLAFHVVAQQPGGQSASKIIAVRAGHLIDGRGGPPAVDVVILVDGERIVAVGPNVAIPTGATGLIDCHTHITLAPGASDDQFRRSFVDAAILAPKHARATLEAGFTTIRDLGAPRFVDVTCARNRAR
jgi:imidazolonepropionase-like amidohydrolase